MQYTSLYNMYVGHEIHALTLSYNLGPVLLCGGPGGISCALATPRDLAQEASAGISVCPYVDRDRYVVASASRWQDETRTGRV